METVLAKKCTLEIPRSERKRNKVRVVMFSDTHGHMKHLKFPEADLLIFAGDFGNKSGNEEKELEDFDNFLGNVKIPHKILIPGNHDFSLHKNKDFKFKNCIHLVNEYVELCGLKIFATSYSETSKSLTEPYKDVESKWKDIPEHLDLLISHYPPFGILDQIKPDPKYNYKTDDEGMYRIGSKFLLKLCVEKKPRICCFGHIHETYGEFKSNDLDTVFLNVSILKNNHTSSDVGEEEMNLPFFVDILI